MASIMDKTDSEAHSNLEPLCPVLYSNKNPSPFVRVYANEVYVVLKV